MIGENGMLIYGTGGWCRKDCVPYAYRSPGTERYCDVCERSRPNELQKLWTHLDRAQSRSLPATLTIDQWIRTLHLCEYRCAYCRSRPYKHFEHYIPLRHGGGTTQSNC